MRSASLVWCPAGRRGGTLAPLVDEGQVTGKPHFRRDLFRGTATYSERYRTRSTDVLSRRRRRRGGGAASSVCIGCLARFRRERLAKHRRTPVGEIGRR